MNLGNIINTEAYEAVPSVSRDGHWLLFHSSRPGGAGGWDIWMSWRPQVHDDLGWQRPIHLGGFVNTPYDDSGARLFQGDSEVTLYFNSTRPGGMGFQDIYTSTLSSDGSFGPAVLVTELNSPAFDNRVAVGFDGLELFVSSNRAGAIGDQDLWTSTRPTIFDPWSEPVNVGSAVNTVFSDFTPEVSRDGRELFFASNRPGGEGGFDLYVMRRPGRR